MRNFSQQEFSMFRKSLFIALFINIILVSAGCASTAPKNIIVFIGDGMGPEQVRAAALYANGQAGTLSFEQFPYQGTATTHSANADVTDSAAAATALATGNKADNGVISMSIPGDKEELTTLLEYYQTKEKSIGLVTTVYITHATPAGFGAHEPARKNLNEIAHDYLHQTQPNVLFGGGEHGMTPDSAKAVGYTVVNNREEMQAVDTESLNMVSGQFGGEIPYEYDGIGNLPHLSEMTEIALKVLDNDPDGFFLMVEGGKIDWAGHGNDLERNIFETIEFANSVTAALQWAKDRNDTLIIVTADHETGGLKVIESNGKGKFPKVTWSTGGHTGVPVGVYAWGAGAEKFQANIDNTDIPKMILSKKSVPAID